MPFSTLSLFTAVEYWFVIWLWNSLFILLWKDVADSNRRLSPRAAVDSLMQVSCSYIFVSVKQILIWKCWIREYAFVSFDKKMSDLSQCLSVVRSCTLVLQSGRFWPAPHLAYPPYRLHPVRSGLVHHSLAVLTLKHSSQSLSHRQPLRPFWFCWQCCSSSCLLRNASQCAGMGVPFPPGAPYTSFFCPTLSSWYVVQPLFWILFYRMVWQGELNHRDFSNG